MATPVALVTAQPRTAATGAATTVWLAGGGGTKPYYYQSNHWQAGVVEMPRLSASIGVDESGFTGGSKPQTGVITFAPALRSTLATLAALVWRNAAISVQLGDEESATFATKLTGKVADASIQENKLVLTIADMTADLDRVILTSRFAGSGGVEGGTEAKDRIKRRSWGRVFNVEGRILDKANNIYEFGDLSQKLQSFETVRDVGRDAAPAPSVVSYAGSVASTLTNLINAVPAQGSCVVAPSIACVKWWTQPKGPLTADIKGEIGSGYVETPAAIVDRILSAMSGPTVTNTAAAVSLRNMPAGIHIDEGDTISNALDRLLLGVSLVWLVDPAGTITIREFTFSSPVEALTSINVTRQRSLPPIKSRRLGYARAYRTHTDGEIATPLLDQYAPLTLTSLGTVGVYINSNRIIRKSGTNVYDAAAVGPSLANTAFASVNIGAAANWVMVALDSNATDYAEAQMNAILEFLPSTGSLFCVIGGGGGFSTTLGAGITGTAVLAYDGSRLLFIVGGIVRYIHTTGVLPDQTYYPKWHAYSNAEVTGLECGPYGETLEIDLQVPSSIDIDVDGAGTVTTPLPLTFRTKAIKARTDISTTTSFAVTFPNGITGSINNTVGSADRGVVTVSDVIQSGNIVITATIPNLPPIVRQVFVNRKPPVPTVTGTGSSTAGSGTGPSSVSASTSILSPITSGTHAAMTPVLTVKSTSGGTLRFSGSIFYLGDQASWAAIKAQYRAVGASTWNDFASETTGAPDGVAYDYPYPGWASMAEATKSGLTADTDYEVRLVGRRAGGSASLNITSLSFQVRQ